SALCAATAADLFDSLRSRWPGLPVVWGVSAAAWIDPDTGRSAFSPHLMGWRNRPLPQDLARALSQREGMPPPSVVNDADAAAWAEARLVPRPGGDAGPSR